MAKPVKFPLKKEVTDLLYRFRSIPDGAKVKAVFLWELIFNATRALVKIRTESLFDESKLATLPELFIEIVPDKTNNTLSIIDSGVGMTKDDLLNRLCTIPDYLQRQHMETIDKCLKLHATSTGGGSNVDLSWIYKGCMGYRLGFFSAYMVADKVSITTKHNGHDQYTWESNCHDSFTIAQDDSLLSRGTKVTLFLKEDQLEYLEEHRLKALVETYPTVITRAYPISISVGGPTKKPILDDDNNKKEDEVPFEILQQQFEGLRKVFVKILGQNVKKVVISNRLFEVASFLSSDMTTFEINPRHHIIEKLRKQAEANPNDVEVKAMVFQQFTAAYYNILLNEKKRLK